MQFIKEHKLTQLSVQECLAGQVPATWIRVPVGESLFEPISYQLIKYDNEDKVRFMIYGDLGAINLPIDNAIGIRFDLQDLVWCSKTPEQVDLSFACSKLMEILEGVSSSYIGIENYTDLVKSLAMMQDKFNAEEQRL